MMRNWFLALALIAGLVGGVPAAAERPRYYGARELNIAGVALGMKPGEVAAVLTKAGYSRVEQIMGSPGMRRSASS